MPVWVDQHLFTYDPENPAPEIIEILKGRLQKFRQDHPEVSIVIPAYNEAHHILRTISSLSVLELPYATELLVIDNASTDRTQELLRSVGVHVVREETQGVQFARTRGLTMAKGKYLLQADADSIYPPKWGIDYIKQLQHPEVMVAYGSHAFIPPERGDRRFLAFYEWIGRRLYAFRRLRHAYNNTFGFNMAVRTVDAREKGSYMHDEGGNEDGQMTLSLMKYGQVAYCSSLDSRVWTSPRRLMDDGSIKGAFKKRIKREMSLLKVYTFLSGEERKEKSKNG